jgi:hypothetical protein
VHWLIVLLVVHYSSFPLFHTKTLTKPMDKYEKTQVAGVFQVWLRGERTTITQDFLSFIEGNLFWVVWLRQLSRMTQSIWVTTQIDSSQKNYSTQ